MHKLVTAKKIKMYLRLWGLYKLKPHDVLWMHFLYNDVQCKVLWRVILLQPQLVLRHFASWPLAVSLLSPYSIAATGTRTRRHSGKIPKICALKFTTPTLKPVGKHLFSWRQGFAVSESPRTLDWVDSEYHLTGKVSAHMNFHFSKAVLVSEWHCWVNLWDKQSCAPCVKGWLTGLWTWVENKAFWWGK